MNIRNIFKSLFVKGPRKFSNLSEQVIDKTADTLEDIFDSKKQKNFLGQENLPYVEAKNFNVANNGDIEEIPETTS